MDTNNLRLRLSNLLGTEIPAIPKNADLERVSKVVDSLEKLGASANLADAMGLSDIAKAMDEKAITGIVLLIAYFASLEQANAAGEQESAPKGTLLN